jgi:KUP system potassium uptake protein
MSTIIKSKSTAALTLGAIGIVFGDIGTSPLYTVKEIFSSSTGIALTQTNIIGAISAIFWALMLVVTLKYVTLILRADNRGEGGIMALLALAVSGIRQQPKLKTALIACGLFGAALFYGDSILTPAISVLSAIEGIEVVTPSFKDYVVPIASSILIGLFLFQRFGTSTVGKLFGPIIVLWFVVLGMVGSWHIIQQPQILAALNPLYAFHFMMDRGPLVLLAIGAVLLAITGAEALYADLGHFGKKAIRYAWIFLVLPGLTLNYLGQGALLISKPEAASNPFYLAFPNELLIFAVVLATLATIIASQAVISGAYSITRQIIQLGFMPRMRILHTSISESGQIYIPAVNWILLVAVIAAVMGFGSSSALASAYGIAVTGTMLITSILAFFVLKHQWKLSLGIAAIITTALVVMDGILVMASSVKFLNGGWFPFVIAGILFLLMWTWKQGREAVILNTHQHDPKISDFIDNIANSTSISSVNRTAVFLVSNHDTTPQALLHNIKHNHVLHAQNLLVTVQFHEKPVLSDEERISREMIRPGFWKVTIHYGFMENPDIPRALQGLQLPDSEFNPFNTSYFVSRDIILPGNAGKMSTWRDALFALMSRNASNIVNYFNIPSNSVIELGSRVHI